MVDANNTSGFFPNQTNGVVAIYTLNTPSSQTQYIAMSYDDGYTFAPYANNPVLDINSTQFRDPKVIWYGDHWVMVVAYATDFTVGIYTSSNLIDWNHASNFSHHGLLGLQYECPNLVPVPVLENGTETGEEKWLMMISINPGAPQGGSIAQYFPGSFDGYTFTALDNAARIADFAKDNYAGQFFYGTEPNEAVSIAWASNWQYTNDVPTAEEGWRSIMSAPRRNYLTQLERTGWDLVSLPYNIDAIKGSELSYDQDFANKSVTVDYSNSTSGALYFEANFTLPENAVLSADSQFNLTWSSSGDDVLKAGYIFGGSNAGLGWINRGGVKRFGEDNPFFTDKFSVAQVSLTKSISGIVDRSVLEMFIDDGALSGTSVFYPAEPLDHLVLASAGMPAGTKIEIAVWDLTSTWNKD